MVGAAAEEEEGEAEGHWTASLQGRGGDMCFVTVIVSQCSSTLHIPTASVGSCDEVGSNMSTVACLSLMILPFNGHCWCYFEMGVQQMKNNPNELQRSSITSGGKQFQTKD